jgi:hypothetical protein
MFKWSLTFVALMLAVIGVMLVHSADTAAQNASVAPASSASTAYNPGVGELMNLIVQPRHTKLWFAGHEENWPLAEYESKELRSALANVAKARPVFRQQSIADNVETFLGAPFRAVDEAIHDRNAAKFSDAYATVNAGCNACHTALSQSQVVIKTPEEPTYPDQEFRPRK